MMWLFITTPRLGIRLIHEEAMNSEPAGDPTYCKIYRNMINGDSTMCVTRGAGISDESWSTNDLQ
jgi:hypothetical protein